MNGVIGDLLPVALGVAISPMPMPILAVGKGLGGL